MADPNHGRVPQSGGLIAAAMIVAAMILSWGSSNSEPRYQLAGSGDGVVRLDTDSGALLACDLRQCRQIEQPLRSKSWGPLSVVIGNVRDDVERREQLQKPPQQQQLPAKH
jgi:hypothetical protein